MDFNMKHRHIRENFGINHYQNHYRITINVDVTGLG